MNHDWEEYVMKIKRSKIKNWYLNYLNEFEHFLGYLKGKICGNKLKLGYPLKFLKRK